MAESPVQAEKLMAGTSDGNVWRREPAGNWMNLTGNLPDRFVTSVQLSPTLSQRLYVTHSGFRNDEYIPHVHRSDNNGATWTDISSDLPQMPVNDLLVLPNHADSVLIVATDAGVYLSKNSGAKWVRLGGNMPVIPVFDVELNPVRKELVAGTFARGIWTIPIDSILAQQPAVVLQLSGNITTEAGAGVSQVHVGNAVSEASGNFQLTAPGCAPFMVTPVSNDNLLNGLTTYDLVLISKHILGIEALGSPFRMIAADANRSNSITTFDIVALRKLILGIDTVLIGNTSWRFVPKSHVFSNPNNPFVGIIPQEIEAQLQGSPMAGLNFTAVKVGDVNNSVQPNAVGPVSDRTVGQYPLRVQDLSFKAQETLEVPFGSSAEALAALQFTIQFDTTRLQFIAVESMMQDISADNFGINRIQQGLLSISLGDQQGIRAETGLFKVIFRVKRSGQLQQALKLGSFPTPALAFRTDGSALLPGLWGGSSSNITVTPNPFGKAGTVLTLETTGAEGETGGHLLEIFDLNGKVLLARTASSGQQVFIESSVFPQAGVYFWRLRSSGRSGKLVFTP
jgi:hypothetical protein